MKYKNNCPPSYAFKSINLYYKVKFIFYGVVFNAVHHLEMTFL
jgi:hypothetical protein